MEEEARDETTPSEIGETWIRAMVVDALRAADDALELAAAAPVDGE